MVWWLRLAVFVGWCGDFAWRRDVGKVARGACVDGAFLESVIVPAVDEHGKFPEAGRTPDDSTDLCARQLVLLDVDHDGCWREVLDQGEPIDQLARDRDVESSILKGALHVARDSWVMLDEEDTAHIAAGGAFLFEVGGDIELDLASGFILLPCELTP